MSKDNGAISDVGKAWATVGDGHGGGGRGALALRAGGELKYVDARLSEGRRGVGTGCVVQTDQRRASHLQPGIGERGGRHARRAAGQTGRARQHDGLVGASTDLDARLTWPGWTHIRVNAKVEFGSGRLVEHRHDVGVHGPCMWRVHHGCDAAPVVRLSIQNDGSRPGKRLRNGQPHDQHHGNLARQFFPPCRQQHRRQQNQQPQRHRHGNRARLSVAQQERGAQVGLSSSVDAKHGDARATADRQQVPSQSHFDHGDAIDAVAQAHRVATTRQHRHRTEHPALADLPLDARDRGGGWRGRHHGRDDLLDAPGGAG